MKKLFRLFLLPIALCMAAFPIVWCCESTGVHRDETLTSLETASNALGTTLVIVGCTTLIAIAVVIFIFVCDSFLTQKERLLFFKKPNQKTEWQDMKEVGDE